MRTDVVITAYGFADGLRFGGTFLEGREKQATIAGPHFHWPAVSMLPFARFERLDLPSRFALVAAEMLGLVPPEDDSVYADYGVILGTKYGCLDTDIQFLRSAVELEGANPAVFSYTLPSAPLAEVAMRYRLGGSNLCLQAGAQSGLAALWEGVQWVRHEEALGCVCMECDAISPASRNSLGRSIHEGASACAFLVETEATARCHGRAPLARVEPIGQVPDPAVAPPALSRLRDFLRVGASSEPLWLHNPYRSEMPDGVIVRRAVRSGRPGSGSFALPQVMNRPEEETT